MYLCEKYDYSMFEARFRDYNRLNHFPEGLRNLYDYLEELAEDTGVPIEVDVVAICCEYEESTLAEALAYCNDCEDIEGLKDHTTVIMVEEGFSTGLNDFPPNGVLLISRLCWRLLVLVNQRSLLL